MHPRFSDTIPLAAIVVTAVAAMLLVELSPAAAQVEGNRVEFTVTVDHRDGDDSVDDDLRSRRNHQIAKKVAERIEQRLDTMDVKNHDVDVDSQHNIRVRAYGNHSPSVIKGAIVPSGHLEIRPVLINDSPWADVASELPADVELRNQPGLFRTDRLYLFAHSAQLLRQTVDEYAPEDVDIKIFPDDGGWRTVHLGPTAATNDDIHTVELSNNPAGLPFVSATISGRAAQSIRAVATAEQLHHIAIVLDGELVGLERFSDRSFSETLTLEPPDHLRSPQARDDWAMQVAGRLAASIPVRLAEIQE